ncbi:hypothetical protein D3C85_1920000 [compost metagenome]
MAAISSGLPKRLNGRLARVSSLNSMVSLISMSVSIGPGATELTSTPLGATSLATALVSAITPPLEAQ